MSEFTDFDLGLVDSTNNATGLEESKITSHFLCTPGCKTGWLEGCQNKTASCNCVISSSSAV
ncbi:gallidermin/nisin family lantibiotic [Weissella sp. MSCH1]|uniref:gallidermin/nisin family lantibiotic n=1 Tax=Weissella sp. MSCH1 TaxID=3383343 RepID=UPI003896ACE3